MATPLDVATAAQLACLVEASAPKPGNVSPGHDFHDTRYEDFLASAVAIGPVLATAGAQPLGTTIKAAVEATRRLTGRNTNLGIVLLLAPLCRAALRPGPDSLRARVATVLAQTTVTDAVDAYAAIRLAAPGGLGTAAAQDVHTEPSVTLREAMALAAPRDTIAAEYASDFAVTFELAVPALRAARRAGLSWTDAAVETHLAVLAAVPDSHIARKLGREAAEAVTRRAQAVRAAGGPRTPDGRAALAALDAELRDPQNTRNPGTSADLTAAALAVVILEDGWHSSGDDARAEYVPRRGE